MKLLCPFLSEFSSSFSVLFIFYKDEIQAVMICELVYFTTTYSYIPISKITAI